MLSKPYLPVFLLSLLPIFAVSQKASFRLYTISDGLPQNSVTNAVQDVQGFIWVNAGGTLSRFDGSQFLNTTYINHPIFKQNRFPLQEIPADGEWLRFCQDGQLKSINTTTGKETAQSLKAFLPKGADTPTAICKQLSKGEIAIICGGLARTDEVYLLPLKDGQPKPPIRLEGIAKLANFRTICSDGLGNIYCVKQDLKAVVQFDAKGKKIREIPVQVPPNVTFYLKAGENNSILLVSNDKILKLRKGATAFEPHPILRNKLPTDLYVLDVVETPEGNLWVSGSSRNLLFFDAKQGKVVNFQQEIEQTIPHQVDLGTILLDKQGSAWIPSAVGVLRVTPSRDWFKTWFTESSDACQGFCSFRGMAEDDEGNVFASFYSNIFQISKNGEALQQPLSPRTHSPYDLLVQDGQLLMNNGNLFDPKTRTWSNPFQSVMQSVDVGVLAKNGKGQIWQTFGDGFHELDLAQPKPQWKLVQGHTGKGFAADMAFDAFKGWVWTCDADNLHSFDPVNRTFKVWKLGNPQHLNNFKCIYPDGKGKLWIGTAQGLFRFDYLANTLQRYTHSNGLSDDIVVGILPEGDSCLWLATFNGLSRLSIASGKFVNFFKQDGLSDNEFNRASFLKASDGRMFFGGTKGITSFYPKQVMEGHARQSTAERLLLHSISLSKDGSDSIITQLFRRAGEALEVYHYNRTVNIEFGVFSALDGGNNLYSYRLEGLDGNWSAPSRNNTVTYSSLPDGKYLFRVRALNARGQWLPEEIALPIIAYPPWWATWWAYLLYAMALAAIGFAIFHFLKKRLELQNQLKLEQREAERLKELDAFKTRLYTNLTHEFRTPLTVILGMAEAGKTEIEKLGNRRFTQVNWEIEDTKERRQSISDFLISNFTLIERNGQNLLRLVNQLLDLSKLEDKSFKLNLQHGDIVPFLRYVTECFQSLANSRNLSLRFHSSLDKLEMDFDPEQLQQVMGNLLSNAMKFTPAGEEVKVEIGKSEIHASKLGGTLISQFPISNFPISITDTGIGIPEADLPHVFDRFYQVDNSSSRAGEGSGIGLAHTLELVKLMGGEISVESQLGKGTTFTVLLPIRNDGSVMMNDELLMMNDEYRFLPKPPTQLANQTEAVLPTYSSFIIHHSSLSKILLIEDSPDVLAYLRTILQDKYELATASNGRIGIEMALEQIPDLIISDVMMPEKDGYQVLDALKHDERTSHIPILLLTARADASSKLTGLRRGADAYVSKPFQKAELLATLDMMLENKRRLAAYFSKQFDLLEIPAKAADGGNPDLPPDAEAVLAEDAFLQKIRGIVENNYADEAFALPQLCEALSMSRSQLFRKLKALADMSPSDYIRNYRMAQAKLLLETTQLPVKEVAWRVGFKEVSHFSKTYQDTYGMAPTAARK